MMDEEKLVARIEPLSSEAIALRAERNGLHWAAQVYTDPVYVDHKLARIAAAHFTIAAYLRANPNALQAWRDYRDSIVERSQP